MTYEEYKRSKNHGKKRSIFKSLLSKLLSCLIVIFIVLIISNYSPSFKSFIYDDVLKNTIDFSKMNKLFNKVTDVFKSDKITPVINIERNYEEYLDGIKYTGEGDVIIKNSGIVTYIGEKEGYNNTIVVQQSDGYYAWYGNIEESVKIYDYVESGSKLGSFEGEYYYVLLKDDVPVEIPNEN